MLGRSKRQKLPRATLYIRRNGQPGQPYERINLKNVEIAANGDVYCLHYYDREGKRKWQTVGTDSQGGVDGLTGERASAAF